MSGRYFLGFKLDTQSEDLLLNLRDRLTLGRWQQREQLHLTITFLGQLSRSQVDELQSLLEELVLSSFEISLQGVGHFLKKNGRAVYFAKVSPSEELIELKEEIDRCIRRLGIKIEKKKFIPHVSVARVHELVIDQVIEFEKKNSLLRSGPIVMNQLILFESVLTPNGAIYKDVYHLELY